MNKLLNNWPAKVLCFVGAVVLFFFHKIDNLEETYFSVPLEVILPEGFIPASEYSHRVKINLKGQGDTVYSILEEDIRAYVDLSNRTQDGRYKASVEIEKKGTALGVDPLEVRVEPSQITLKLEKEYRKSIEVFPSISGYPAQGFKLDHYYMSPSSVDVVGPMSMVNSLRAITTEEVDISGREEDFTQRVRLVKDNDFLEYPGGNVVEFQGIIKQASILKTVDNLQIGLNDLAADLQVVGSLPEGRVQVKGLQRELESYKSYEYGLTIDCSDITEPGTYTKKIETYIPEGLLLLEYSPKVMTLEIKSKETP